MLWFAQQQPHFDHNWEVVRWEKECVTNQMCLMKKDLFIISLEITHPQYEDKNAFERNRTSLLQILNYNELV